MFETIVIVGVVIPVAVSIATVIALLWTGWERSDRYCRQLEAVLLMLDEYQQADAERLESPTDAEDSA